jgi:hypothetical protein
VLGRGGPSARRTLTRCSARSSGTTKTSMATGLPSSLVGTSGTYVTSRRLRRDHGLPTPKVDANDSARCSSAASASSNRFRRLTRVERQRVLRTSYVPTVVSSSTAALTVPAAHLVVNVDVRQCAGMSPERWAATALGHALTRRHNGFVRQAACILIVGLAAGLWVGAAYTAAPPSAGLAARAARITRLLPGWASHDSSLSSAPCRIAPASEETARIAPTYTSPKTLHPAVEVDLTIARWRSAALARAITGRVGNAKALACIRAHQTQLYKHNYHRSVAITFSAQTPTWVKPDPAALLHGYTQTIHVAGYKTPLIYVELAFIDKADPSVAWSVGFFDYGQLSAVPLFKKILAAGER